MYVHLNTRRCNCCGFSLSHQIVDIPVEEIKLSKFAIPCSCGYFFTGEHYPVNFDKWQVQISKFQDEIANIERELKVIELVKKDTGMVNYRQPVIENHNRRLEYLYGKLKEYSVPVPNHLMEYSQ